MRVYRSDHDYREYVISTESGRWMHYEVESMRDEENIEWFKHDGDEATMPKLHRVKASRYPKWLKYFTGRYSWMFNDPLSWKRDGYNEIEIRIPYKWPKNERGSR